MITRINMKNWRSHKDTTLEFSQGTNALIGIMGSGKTSVLDAISYGLFGTFPILQSKKIKLEDVVTKKPKEEKMSEVRIDFVHNEDEYSVKRTIDKGRSTAELRKNGKLIEAPQTQKVTDEITKLLKVDYDLFTRAIYSEQNQLDMFLTIPKGQRMKKIDQLLSIDRFEKARSSTVTLSNRMKTVSSEKQKLLFSLKSDDSIKNMQMIKHDLEMVKKDRLRLHEQLRTTRQSRENISKRLEALRETDNKRRKIEEDIRTSIALLKATQEDVERLSDELKENVERPDEEIQNEMSSYEQKAEILKTNLDGEKLRIDVSKQMVTIKETKINMITEEKLPEFEKKVKERRAIEKILDKGDAKKLSKELGKKKKEIENSRNAVQRALAGIEETEKSMKEFHDVKDSCPICDQKITKIKKKSILKKKKQKMSDLKKLVRTEERDIEKMIEDETRLEAAVRDYDKLREKYDSLSDASKQLKFLKQAHDQLRKELTKHRREVKIIEKAISSVQKDYEKEFEKIRSLRQILEMRTEAMAKVKKARELGIMLTNLQTERHKFIGFSPEAIEKVDKEFQSMIGLEKGLEAKIESTESMMKEKEKRITDAEGKLHVIEKYAADAKNIEDVIEQLQMFSSALESTQSQLRINFVTAVNQAMQMIWQDLYPYKDFHSARLGITDGDYVLQLLGNSGWTNADGLVSGGERSIACLALRIAFSLVLAPQMRLLVLDEPTHNLDAKAVNDLGNVLRERMNEFIEQVFLITHDPALENAVSGHLYKLEREKESDGFTKAIRLSGPDN